ncbi:MAG: hypothetical protein JST42_28325 [Bacteroidetes bacterium]|nr:hypothetical protein [Bacteroidota bacterium]
MKPGITTFYTQEGGRRGSVRPFKNNYLRMKQNILLFLLCLGLLPAGAQKIIEKHIDFAPSGFVRMNFQISDSIRIITWKKNEVYIRSSINVNDNQNNDDYKMVFGETGNTINVSARLDLPRGACCGGKKDSSGKVIHSGGTTVNGDNDCCCCCSCHSQIFHEVYVPENADFSVETINGNITITGNTAEIRAKSISGYIDLAIAPSRKADLKMRTISGTMYSNIELTSTSRRIKQVGGGTVTAQLNGGGGKEIELETISGNIFFRKEG